MCEVHDLEVVRDMIWFVIGLVFRESLDKSFLFRNQLWVIISCVLSAFHCHEYLKALDLLCVSSSTKPYSNQDLSGILNSRSLGFVSHFFRCI